MSCALFPRRKYSLSPRPQVLMNIELILKIYSDNLKIEMWL